MEAGDWRPAGDASFFHYKQAALRHASDACHTDMNRTQVDSGLHRDELLQGVAGRISDLKKRRAILGIKVLRTVNSCIVALCIVSFQKRFCSVLILEVFMLL